KLRRKKLDSQMSKSGGGYGFDVKKSGDATVVLLGLPSVGKSSLISKITNKESKVGHYAFTTLDAIPGILQHDGAKIQIIDLPGIIEGASEGKGRGKEILAVARTADMIAILVTPENAEKQINIIMKELYKVAIRPGAKEPYIKIKKTDKGGIAISTLHKMTHMSEKTFAGIMREYKISNAIVTVRSDPTMEELIDVLEGNRVYPKKLIIVNKIDQYPEEEIEKLKQKLPDAVFISALTEENLDELKDVINDKLELMKIWMKKQGEKTDFKEPLIIKQGSTVRDVCHKIHRRFESEFRYAIVSGPSAKHPNQRVGLEHILQDGDILTIIIHKKW
ncbi:MAG: OBG GTPase family GTP-binding protein, partial [Candidatus Heimdallarchaeaceae archaeon]